MAVADPAAGTDWFWPSFFIGLAALAGLGVWAVLRVIREVRATGTAMVQAAGDSAVRVADSLADALRTGFNVDPAVRVNGMVRSDGTFAERELVTVRQALTCERTWSQRRFGSTKEMTLSARFTVRAGFDLGRPIRVDVGPDGRWAEVSWPAARILSVQIDEFAPAQEESGWWNRITPEDRAGVQRELQRAAEEAAASAGLLERAESELRQLLEEQLRPTGSTLQLTFGAVEEPGSRGSTGGRMRADAGDGGGREWVRG